jgi:ABC-2 type transport system permease protein
MMTNIMNADFYKLRKNIASWLLPAASIVATLVTAVFMFFVDNGLTVEGGQDVRASDVFGFTPEGAMGVQALQSNSSVFAILAVVFAGLFVSNEFATGTIRNALCIGKSRIQVYLSKLTMSSVMLFVIMFVSAVAFTTSFTIMYGFGNDTDFAVTSIKVFALQLLYHLAYASLACMFAFLIQNTVFSVSVGIFCVVISGTLTDIFTAFDGLGLFARLMPNYYITRLADNFTDSSFILQSVAASLVFIVITSIVGCVVFRRRDVK